MEKSLTKGQPDQSSNTPDHEMSLLGVGVLRGLGVGVHLTNSHPDPQADQMSS